MATGPLPADFLWGFATASYQIEGATTQDGRGPSIWDAFCQIPGKIADGSSGEVACDSYNRSGEDIALLKETGARAYRFSLSWSRIIPLGGRHDPINEKGLHFYVTFVDDLRAAGIIPMVTLFHWDLPDALDSRYGGLLDKDDFVADYVRYARVVFAAMGAKVRRWITFNEPWCSAILGYSTGDFAPGRTSNRAKSTEGDSSIEPWVVGHNILVAHGSAVRVYREEFKGRDGGSPTLGDWAYPFDASSADDVAAAQRRFEFAIAWFAGPIYHGTYPASLRQQLGARLPSFTPSELALIHGSHDVYGMNHHCVHFVRHLSAPPTPEDYLGNVEVGFVATQGREVGPET